MTEATIRDAENHILDALREAGELAFWEIRENCDAIAALSDDELEEVLRHAIDSDRIGTLWGDGTIFFIPLC